MLSWFKKRNRFIPNKQLSREDVESFVYKWNLDYPIDRWWREKHKVVFNSPEHRVVSFLDMYIEWLEDHIYSEASEKNFKNTLYKNGDWLTERKSDIDQSKDIEDWEKLDLSKFDDR